MLLMYAIDSPNSKFVKNVLYECGMIHVWTFHKFIDIYWFRKTLSRVLHDHFYFCKNVKMKQKCPQKELILDI